MASSVARISSGALGHNQQGGISHESARFSAGLGSKYKRIVAESGGQMRRRSQEDVDGYIARIRQNRA